MHRSIHFQFNPALPISAKVKCYFRGITFTPFQNARSHCILRLRYWSVESAEVPKSLRCGVCWLPNPSHMQLVFPAIGTIELSISLICTAFTLVSVQVTYTTVFT